MLNKTRKLNRTIDYIENDVKIETFIIFSVLWFILPFICCCCCILNDINKKRENQLNRENRNNRDVELVPVTLNPLSVKMAEL